MQTEKAKQKRAPRTNRLIFAILALTVIIMLGGVLMLPYAEVGITKWLEDDPFTPTCHNENLEIAFTSDVEGLDYIYRMRLNDSAQKRVSDLSDPRATQLDWSPDGNYLVFYMANARPTYLNFLSAQTGKVISIDINMLAPTWSILPDSSAILMQDTYENHYTLFQIDFPITESSEIYQIYQIPSALFLPSNRTLNSQQNDFNEVYEDTITSLNGEIVASTRNPIPRARFDKQNRIFVYDKLSKHTFWEIGADDDDKRVEYIIQDISLSNDLLYIRRSFRKNSDTPEQVFVAHINEQRAEPIIEQRASGSISGLFWSPDNRWMLIALKNRDTGTVNTYIADYDGSNQILLSSIPSDNYTTDSFAWTPDGKYFSYIDANHWIYLFNPESHEKCRVAKGASEWSTIYDWGLIED